MKKYIYRNKEGAVRESKCFDCSKSISIEGDEIKDGQLLEYKDSRETFFVIKCDECFSKDEGISNYKPCEVYSRIVGYLRPVQNWNEGKKQEFVERATFEYSKEEGVIK